MISDKQLKILAFPYTNYRVLICDGAIRSGKTSLMTVAFIDWAMREFNNTCFAICGKTVGSARRNIIKPYTAMKYARDRYKITENISEKTMTVRRGNKTNVFYIFGGKDEGSAALIQGMTLGGVLLDEVVLMPRSFVEQAIARCSLDGYKLMFNCNPGSPEHWFYNDWIKDADGENVKNILHLHFRIEDNPGLSEERIREYYATYEGVFYERFVLGNWVRAEGLIYSSFANNSDLFIVDECKENLVYITIGVDYGASKSHTAFKATGFTHGFKTVYSIAECDSEGVAEPNEIYRRFEEFYLSVVKRWSKCFYVFADYGALGQVLTNGLMLYMQRKGYPVQIQDCIKGRIVERIELVSQLMAQGRYKILRSCPRLIRAFKDAVWDEKHDDIRLDDGSTDVDSLDAFEYSIFPLYDKLI